MDYLLPLRRKAIPFGIVALLLAQEAPAVVVLQPTIKPVKDLTGEGVQRDFVRPLTIGEPLDFEQWARSKYPELEPEAALAAARQESAEGSVGSRIESVITRNPLKRPALYAAESDFLESEKIPPEWFEDLNRRRGEISDVLRSVGRLEVFGMNTRESRFVLGSTPGTAFVVAPSVLMTNRHVANWFVQYTANEFKQNPETREKASVYINFGAVMGNDFNSGKRFRVDRILYVSRSGPDVALLRFDDPGQNGPPPLALQLQPPAGPVELTKAFVVGFPSGDYTFFKIPNVKRVAPGLIRQVVAIEPSRPLIYHDCSTESGNSGSPVVELDSGRVFGIHYAGHYEGADTSNHAEVMWNIAAISDVQMILGIGEVEAPDLEHASPSVAGLPRPSVLLSTGRDGELIPRSATSSSSTTTAGLLRATREASGPLRTVGRSVGLIRDAKTQAAGTGFLIAPGIVATAFPVVAAQNAATDGARWSIAFDEGRPGEAHVYEITGWSSWGDTMNGGIAIGRLAMMTESTPPPLSLDLDPPGDGDRIAVIGYNFGTDARLSPEIAALVFEGPDGAKRVSPGLITSIDPNLIYYDASTAAGSTGSPIVDLDTGKVLGIHVGGETERGNFGVSMGRLINDFPDLRVELLGRGDVPNE